MGGLSLFGLNVNLASTTKKVLYCNYPTFIHANLEVQYFGVKGKIEKKRNYD